MIDISVIGVGLELFGSPPEDLIGRRLVVEVQTPIGASVGIHLVGEVRNTAPGPDGGSGWGWNSSTSQRQNDRCCMSWSSCRLFGDLPARHDNGDEAPGVATLLNLCAGPAR